MQFFSTLVFLCLVAVSMAQWGFNSLSNGWTVPGVGVHSNCEPPFCRFVGSPHDAFPYGGNIIY